MNITQAYINSYISLTYTQVTSRCGIRQLEVKKTKKSKKKQQKSKVAMTKNKKKARQTKIFLITHYLQPYLAIFVAEVVFSSRRT